MRPVLRPSCGTGWAHGQAASGRPERRSDSTAAGRSGRSGSALAYGTDDGAVEEQHQLVGHLERVWHTGPGAQLAEIGDDQLLVPLGGCVGRVRRVWHFGDRVREGAAAEAGRADPFGDRVEHGKWTAQR